MDTIDRLPPNSAEAEQGVLGCIFLDPYTCIYECITVFRDGGIVFFDFFYRTIYEVIVEMVDSLDAIDSITVSQKLKDRGIAMSPEQADRFYTLPEKVPSAANLSYYIEIVRSKYALRQLISACTEIVAKAYDWQGEADELIDQAESDFLNATRRQSSKIAVQCMPAVQRAMERIEKYSQNQGALTGISYGFPDLDKITSGMKGGEMIVIAARPSIGKTSLAMNIADAVAIEQKLPVGVFSLEMTEDQLIERCILSRARVNIKNVREGFFSERDYPKLTISAGRIGGAPIYIDDSSGLSIMELRARARRMWQMYGIKLFVIDYLQLLCSTSKRAQNRQQEIGDISRGVKALAKDLDVPVIVLSQLNREIEKDKNRKPRLSDLRESGDVEQDADTIGLLYKPAKADDDDNGWEREAIPVNLFLGKQRLGPAQIDINLTFLTTYTRFESAAKISADDLPPETQPMI